MLAILLPFGNNLIAIKLELFTTTFVIDDFYHMTLDEIRQNIIVINKEEEELKMSSQKIFIC